MIQLDWAMLAEAADFHGGLLTISGGGAEKLVLDELPGRQKLSLAARFVGGSEDAGKSFTLTLRILDKAGEAIVAGVDGVPDTTLQTEGRLTATGDRPDGFRPTFLWAADFEPRYPEAGPYRLEVQVDGNVVGALMLMVEGPPPPG